jgi:hypothetical protein
MSDDSKIRIEIEGDEGASDQRSDDALAAREAAAAEADARRAHSALAHAHAELLQSKRNNVLARLDAIDKRTALAVEEFKNAGEDGDFARQARAQQAISQLEAARVEHERYGQHLANVRIPVDPVEEMAASVSPRSAEWIRQHRDIVSTERGRSKVLAAHSDAIAEGMTPDTYAYFAHINRFVGGRGGTQGQQKASYGSRGPTVKLTAEQYKAATDGSLTYNSGPKRGQPLGPAEYARRILAMQKTHPDRI